ncbi:LptE family protein [Sunxiuqinia elliptica]|uniref:Lipopolysaccharide assembly protein n=1 Tax=Sunxiuqinia elliptica TaxID=655355 RepID=A0A4R6H578_9BACT|nr:LptE family protein [Sunxiuqinia elliptica]TDO03322.1 lipopolysaccharide assembly protein [Sunxiuqinia elliptica]TDO59519.1 lipopolysaccharide assembly protein [Sunxiuqinia elliptica]
MTLIKSLRSWMLVIVLVVAGSGLFQSCKVSYSFTGASLSPLVKTFTVYYFPNRARLINPNLSQQLTEGLQDKLLRQTSLDLVEERGDLEFEGQITGYDTRPMNISQGDKAAQTRLTVTVRVKYTNNLNHDEDWEKTFTAYEDFEANRILSDVEDELIETILEKLTEDIFNASIANW